ncbi:MAG: antirestriction protein ArdA [Microthrixaceae bacterium]
MEHQEQHPPDSEAEPRRSQPRIYVASLSDFNAGHLLGAWIDADDEPEALLGAIDDMLQQSTEPVAEEWAIHDQDGFSPLVLSEFESIDTVSRIAQGITEHGIAFAHWAAEIGTDQDDLDAFEDHYLGHWPSMTAFAEELADDFGIEQQLDAISEPFRWYIRVDYDAFARDLSLDYLTSEDHDGIHLWSHP